MMTAPVEKSQNTEARVPKLVSPLSLFYQELIIILEMAPLKVYPDLQMFL